MAKKKGKISQQKVFNEIYKKDTTGLFDGGYKASYFKTEIEKEDYKRKTTKDWIEFSEENEDTDDDLYGEYE